MDRMRKSKFTEEQIAMALRQGEAGTPIYRLDRPLHVPGGQKRPSWPHHHTPCRLQSGQHRIGARNQRRFIKKDKVYCRFLRSCPTELPNPAQIGSESLPESSLIGPGWVPKSSRRACLLLPSQGGGRARERPCHGLRGSPGGGCGRLEGWGGGRWRSDRGVRSRESPAR